MGSGGPLGGLSFVPVNRLVIAVRRIGCVGLVVRPIEVHPEHGDHVREKRFDGTEQPREQAGKRQSESRPRNTPGWVVARAITLFIRGQRQPLPDPRVPLPG